VKCESLSFALAFLFGFFSFAFLFGLLAAFWDDRRFHKRSFAEKLRRKEVARAVIANGNIRKMK